MTKPKRMPAPVTTANAAARTTTRPAVAMTPAPATPPALHAHDLLAMASSTITTRGQQRDSGQGQERSMAVTVAAFNAIEGTQLTERQGWAFMKTLKMVRAATTARNGLFNPDDALDGAAYAALEGEAAAKAYAAQQQREVDAQ